MIRIVAGEFGGRRVAVPPGGATRPTSERAREALFSMIGPIEGECVLDLFAGSGALGIEALSRGASQAVFVDRARAAVDCVESNLSLLGAEARVIRSDWRTALAMLRREGCRFDFVFVDPPYAEAAAVMPVLAAHLDGLLAPGATIACEGGTDSPAVTGLRLLRERRHGDTLLRLYATD